MLGKIALDLFSIPAMSAECEREFSSTADLITDDRCRLKATTIEAVECQKNWIRNGVVRSWLKPEDKLHLRKLTSDIVALQIGDEMGEIAGSTSDSEVVTSLGM